MDYGAAPDEELVRAFRAGDYAAFEVLVHRYEGPIYNVTLRILGNHADAEDASQAAFVQAFESLPRTPNPIAVRPWLFQVARNKCMDLLRRRRAVPLSQLARREDNSLFDEPVDPAPLPLQLYEHEELQRLLQAAIDTLSLRAREVVVMRYVGGLTFADIAAALHIPENTAKTLFQRAKSRLRLALRAQM